MNPLGALLSTLGELLNPLGDVLEALGGVLEALESVLEALDVVLEAMLGQDSSKQAHESENVEKHKENQGFLASRGGVLGVSWRSWKRLGSS